MVTMRYNDYYPNDMVGKRKFLEEFFDNCANLGVGIYRESQNLTQLKYVLNYTDA